MNTKTLLLCAAGAVSLTFLANGPAEALTTVLTKTFSYSTPITAGETGSLAPSGGMSATFGPIRYVGVSSVEIDWTYTESFSGNTGGGESGGGMTFGFGGTAYVNGVGYDGNGTGAGNGGPADTPLSIVTDPTSVDDVFPNIDADPNIILELTGPSAYTVQWDISEDEGFNSTGTGFGTLSGVGEVQVTYTYAAAPEPETWALLLIGFAGVGALARSRARPRLSATR